MIGYSHQVSTGVPFDVLFHIRLWTFTQNYSALAINSLFASADIGYNDLLYPYRPQTGFYA